MHWNHRFIIVCILLCVIPACACAELVELAFGYEVNLPEGAVITNETWTPDSSSIIYQIDGYYIDQSKRFNANIFLKDDKLENADKAMSLINFAKERTTGFIPSKGDLGIFAAFSWDMEDATFSKAKDDIESFIKSLVDIPIIQNNGISNDIVIAKTLPQTSKVFGKVRPSPVMGSIEIPVGGNRYIILAKEITSTDVAKAKVINETEGSVLNVIYGLVTENNTIVDQYNVYQYYPLPEDFPQDIEYMSDEEYLRMIDQALNALAEEKAYLLRELLVNDFNLTNPEIIVNEALKLNHKQLQEQISNLSTGGWQNSGFNSNLAKKETAIRLCQYWEIFDESEGYHRDYLVDGIRWLEVNGALIGGYMGGISHCAIFDDALHFVRGNFDLRSIKRIDNQKEPE